MEFYVEEYNPKEHFGKVVAMEMTPLSKREGDAVGYPFMDAKRVLVLHLELSSSSYVILDKTSGAVIGAFGLILETINNKQVGKPWLSHNGFLQTSSNNVNFIKRSREIVNGWLKLGHIKALETDVLMANEVSIRWLKWLGFLISYPKVIEKETFYHCVKSN